MRHFLLYISVGLVAFAIYYTAITVYFLQLRNKLKNKSFESLIKRLGENYRYKELSNGLTRYKWKKGLITIRADLMKN